MAGSGYLPDILVVVFFVPQALDAQLGVDPRGAVASLLREGDPVNWYPFIEAEKAQRRNVKRACELLKVIQQPPADLIWRRVGSYWISG
jgi:hypothetical protein